MGTQSEWAYNDLQTPKTVKTAHKISLVSPNMDVDVTGVSLKNVRTHLIDHPKDEGLKHREQLWNFQQKYRGAIAKVRQASITVVERKLETSGSDEQPEVLEESRQSEEVRSRNPGDQSSLPSRFRKRLRQKAYVGLRTSEFYTDSGKSCTHPSKEQKDDEKTNPGIQRMYSSGLLSRNNLYNQLRSSTSDDKKLEHFGDNSRILEAIQKYGSLEKLPDISYPGLKSTQPPNIRFLKSLSSYNKRFIDPGAERRLISLRRSFTNIGDLVSSKRKLIIVSRRHNDDRMIKLGCIGPYTEESDESDDDDVEDDDEEENDREIEDGEGQNDEDDECDNENQIQNTEKLHRRDCDQKNPEHLNIRENITHLTSQDDAVLYERHKHDENHNHKQLREKTFHGETRKTSEENRREYRRTDLAPQEPYTPKNNRQVKESWNQTKVGTRPKEKDGNKERVINNKRSQQKKEKENSADGNESDDSLDIPDDKYGPTTHSIDRKLAIRKPWEWKPSPYRWIDKPYIRESDKPYIERIINKGEIIDEYHYDSFARTKPLKVQAYPEGAGYKDRYGVMR